MKTSEKSMYKEIEVDLLNRLKNQTDSRMASADEVVIAWLLGEIKDLEARIWSNDNVDQSTNTKGAGCGISR